MKGLVIRCLVLQQGGYHGTNQDQEASKNIKEKETATSR